MVAGLDILSQPDAVAYGYGLFSGATIITDSGFAPRGQNYTWREQGCTPGDEWPYCWTPVGATEKQISCDAWGTAEPFVVYDGIRCQRVGFPDGQSVALSRLGLSEQGQVERHTWAQLANYDPTQIVTANGSGDIIAAIAALEAQLAASTGARGIIHAPRAAAVFLAAVGVNDLIPDGSGWKTPLGTRIVFGGGYDYNGPAGQPPATEGELWLYATGPVVIRRGDVVVHGGDSEGMDRTTNEVNWIAERPYLVSFDCPVLAAQATWPERPDTVWPLPEPVMRISVAGQGLGPYTATVTGAANCTSATLDWGDGTPAVQVPITDQSGTATHTYTE